MFTYGGVIHHSNISDPMINVCGHAINTRMYVCKLWIAGRRMHGICVPLAYFLDMNVLLTFPQSDDPSMTGRPISCMWTLCRH